MHDVAIELPGRPGSLARFGEALGASGVSLEGGGVFTVGGVGHAHFLVDNGEAARAALEQAGLGTAIVRPVLIRRLKQEMPGQLGAIARALGDAGVNIETQYSDHANRLVLVVDDMETAERVTSDWVE
jgi:hypothetical protein